MTVTLLVIICPFYAQIHDQSMLSHYIELELSMKEIIVEYLLNFCKLLLIKVGYCIVNKISQFIVNKFSLFFKLLTLFSLVSYVIVNHDFDL